MSVQIRGVPPGLGGCKSPGHTPWTHTALETHPGHTPLDTPRGHTPLDTPSGHTALDTPPGHTPSWTHTHQNTPAVYPCRYPPGHTHPDPPHGQ